MTPERKKELRAIAEAPERWNQIALASALSEALDALDGSPPRFRQCDATGTSAGVPVRCSLREDHPEKMHKPEPISKGQP